MGADSVNTYVHLSNGTSTEVRHYGPYGDLLDVTGSVINPSTAWFRHHLGNASIDETSPSADAAHFKTAALDSNMVASLRALDEDDLADWMEAYPQGSGWVASHGHPAAKEWAES